MRRLVAGAAISLVATVAFLGGRASAQPSFEEWMFVRDASGTTWKIGSGTRVGIPIAAATEEQIQSIPASGTWLIPGPNGGSLATQRPAWDTSASAVSQESVRTPSSSASNPGMVDSQVVGAPTTSSAGVLGGNSVTLPLTAAPPIQVENNNVAAGLVGAAPQTVIGPQATWRTVVQYSGRGDRQTEPIDITTDAWRIAVNVPSPVGDLSPEVCVSVARISDGGRVSSQCYKETGTSSVVGEGGAYFLSIQTAQEWTVTVEVP